MIVIALFCLFSYFIGSISSAIIVCRLLNLPDPRNQGSRNPGATNVLRLGGKKAAFITLLGDALKGFIPVFLAMMFTDSPTTIGAIMVAVFLGHLYPIFFGFQGGKGVATFIGILFGLSWIAGLIFLIIWLLMVILFRISSLAALTAASLSLLSIFCLLPNYIISILIIIVFLFWRHKENIKRLLKGTEPKMNI